MLVSLPAALVFGACFDGKFAFPTCSDGLKNGYESDVDCGGEPGLGCARCAEGQACEYGYDCETNVCDAGVCATGATSIELAAGERHTCVNLDGKVRCWGIGPTGALGYGNTTTIGDDEVPADAGYVDIGGDASQISAGGDHTCALLDDGSVVCWGNGPCGELGYGNTTTIGDDELPSDAGPVPLGSSGARAVELAAGTFHTCVLLDTGGVRCWGYGGEGALGYGNTLSGLGIADGSNIGDTETLDDLGGVDVDIGGTVEHIVAGRIHTCALYDVDPTTGGSVRCWGQNAEGQLGHGLIDQPARTQVGDDESPSAIDPVLTGVAQIVAGGAHTCGLLVDGTVRCWGYGPEGALGYGSTETIGDGEGVPTDAVPIGGTVIELAAGRYHTCARLEAGEIRCWGRGLFGVLGYGNSDNIGDDETLSELAMPSVQIEPVERLALGGEHTCALLSPVDSETGTIKCWGYGSTGALGYGSTATLGDDETPLEIDGVPYR